MLRKLKRKLKEWLEDTVHKLKTGESTIRCFDGEDWHKVFINPTEASRVSMSEVLRTNKAKRQLDACARIAKQHGAKPFDGLD